MALWETIDAQPIGGNEGNPLLLYHVHHKRVQTRHLWCKKNYIGGSCRCGGGLCYCSSYRYRMFGHKNTCWLGLLLLKIVLWCPLVWQKQDLYSTTYALCSSSKNKPPSIPTLTFLFGVYIGMLLALQFLPLSFFVLSAWPFALDYLLEPLAASLACRRLAQSLCSEQEPMLLQMSSRFKL